MCELGQVLLDDHDHRVQGALKAKRPITITFSNYLGTDCYTGLAVNSGPDMASDIGHALATEGGTFGCSYYIGSDLKVKMSLRSNGDYDVSEIAKRLGGGGHRNAAGCETSVDALMAMLGAVL